MKTRFIALAVMAASPAFAASDTYTIDSKHTFPSFEISHFGYSLQRGRFDKTKGTVTLDLAAKTGSVDVTIDTASVDTGLDALEEHLRKPEFFNVEKFPTMGFKSSKFVFKGDTLAAIEGNFTLLGVTKPLTLNVDMFKCAYHPMFKKEVCGANATTTIKRSEFGMTQYLPALGDDVKITLNIEAGKNEVKSEAKS